MPTNQYIRYPTLGGGSVSIGTPIGGGTSGSVLFVDSFGQLAQDNADFFYNSTTNALTITGIFSAANVSGNNTGDVTLAPVGAAPNANAATLTGQVLNLEPANATNPGVVTAIGQSFGGVKTFTGMILADGGLDVTATGGSDTLSIGISNADIINIGRSGATINITGNTFYQNVTNLNVADKLITVNVGGSAGSASDSGLEIEENAVITGYMKTNGTRDAFRFKAPGSAGEILLKPDTTAFTNTIASGTLTASRTYTLPDASGVVVLDTAAQTLTNKSIDADLNTITNIENADIKAGAAIDATKIADGSVTNAEFQFINSLTSNAQTQLDNKATRELDNLTVTAVNADLNPDGDQTRDFGASGLRWWRCHLSLIVDDGGTNILNAVGRSLHNTIGSNVFDFSGTHPSLAVHLLKDVVDPVDPQDAATKNYVDTTGGTVTSVALALPASVFTVSGSPVTTSGTLTGSFATQTANTVFAGPASAGPSVPTFRALVAADIPLISLTTGVSGILPIANGGTGQSSASAAFDALSPMTTLGDTIYGGASGSGTRLAGNITAVKQFLSQTGTGAVSAAPVWSALVSGDIPNNASNTTGTASNVTGVVAIANGGTGQTTASAGFNALAPATAKGGLIGGTGANTYGNLAVGTDGYVLTADSGQTTGLIWAPPATNALSVVTKTANYTLTTSDDTVLADSSGGGFTLTLPSAAGNSGKLFRILKVSSDVTAISIVMGSTTAIHTQNEELEIQSDGTSWYVLNRYIPSLDIAYTPTITSFGTATSVNFISRRVGNRLEVRGFFVTGTTVNSTASVSLGFNGGNNNVTTDAALIVGTYEIAGSILIDTTTDDWGLLVQGGQQSLAFSRQAGGPFTAMTGDNLNSGVTVSFTASVPIDGWNG